MFVENRLSPLHSRLGEEDRQRGPRLLVRDPAVAPQDAVYDERANVELDLGVAEFELRLEVLVERRPGDADGLGDLLARDAADDHRLDLAALLVGWLELG